MRYTIYTDATPNPIKVHIALEELGIAYESIHVDFSQNEQKSSKFLKLNPNGRIPVLIDHEQNDFAIIESGAILLYLAEEHGQFLPKDTKGRSEAIQWLMWQMGNFGPMFGQFMAFKLGYQDRVTEASQRYDKEVRRLFGVLNTRLNNREYLAGEHSVADMAVMGWMMPVHRYGLFDLTEWPNVKAWNDRLMARPGYQKGFAAPKIKPQEKIMAGVMTSTIGLDTYVPVPNG